MFLTLDWGGETRRVEQCVMTAAEVLEARRWIGVHHNCDRTSVLSDLLGHKPCNSMIACLAILYTRHRR